MKKEFFYVKATDNYVITIPGVLGLTLNNAEMNELMDLVISTENEKHDNLEKDNKNEHTN